MTQSFWPEISDRGRLEPFRQITIEHLQTSWQSGVPVTLVTHADASALLRKRAEFKDGEPAVTVTVLIAHTLARALARHPEMNATIDDRDLVRFKDVNLGIALSLDDGNLVVPVVRSANHLGPEELTAELNRLRERAEHNKLELADVRGGTFTLSSVGMLIDDVVGSASIPPGQAGILLVSGITERPVAVDGELKVAKQLPLSLTVDHRVVNGAAMCRFLVDLRESLETGRPDGPVPTDR